MTDLWDHQLRTVDLAQTTAFLYDMSDAGTGKTRAHLEIFHRRVQEGLTHKLLILCPMTLMEAAWGADIERFYPQYKISYAYAAIRTEAFAKNADIYITNLDGVKWLSKWNPRSFEGLFGWNSSLIIDEATAFKNHTAQRTKAAMIVAGRFPWRSLLSATPAPNSLMELWSQMMLLDGGARLGRSYFRLRNVIQNPINERTMVVWKDKPEAKDSVSLLLQDVTIRHKFDEVMNIPEMTTHVVEFTMPPDAQIAYDTLKHTALLEIKTTEQTVTAINAAATLGKLLQVASGSVYDTEGMTHAIYPDRYELIADLIQAREHSIVFYSWDHQGATLAKVCQKRAIPYAFISSDQKAEERARIVREYQEGCYQVLFLHPRTGAHGLTLTRGRTVIWASPRFEADLLVQGMARIRRGGQTQTTETLFIAAKNTIEPEVYRRLNDKTLAMNNLLELLEG